MAIRVRVDRIGVVKAMTPNRFVSISNEPLVLPEGFGTPMESVSFVFESEPIAATRLAPVCSVQMPDGFYAEGYGDSAREACMMLLLELKAHYGRHFRIVVNDREIISTALDS